MGANESKEEVVKEKGEENYPDYKPPENDYQLVFEAIKDLEYIMLQHFESNGDTLHEMIGTANQILSQDLIIDMRALATTRNNLAHEYSFQSLQNRQEFIDKYRKCAKRLNEEVARRKKEDDEFYNDIVQKYRAKNPRPKFALLDSDATNIDTPAAVASCPVACF